MMPATSQKPDSASRNASGSAASNSQQNAQQSTSATTPATNDGNEETTPTAPKVNRPSGKWFFESLRVLIEIRAGNR